MGENIGDSGGIGAENRLGMGNLAFDLFGKHNVILFG